MSQGTDLQQAVQGHGRLCAMEGTPTLHGRVLHTFFKLFWLASLFIPVDIFCYCPDEIANSPQGVGNKEVNHVCKPGDGANQIARENDGSDD